MSSRGGRSGGGPVVGINIVDIDAANEPVGVYTSDPAAADVRLFAFFESPRVVPTLAPTSNVWRTFKLGVAAHRNTNGVSDIARYGANCARVAAARILHSGDDNAAMQVARVHGMLRLAGEDAGTGDDLWNLRGHDGNDERASAQQSFDKPTASSTTKHRVPRDEEEARHVERASRDVERIDSRLQQLQHLSESLGRDGDRPDADRDQDNAGTIRGLTSSSTQQQQRDSTLTYVARPSSEGPSRTSAGRDDVAPAAGVGPESHVEGTARPIVVNQDDADDEEMARLLDELSARTGRLTTSERRSLDALRTCHAVLNERTTEVRVAITAVLAEAVTLKRQHALLEDACSVHPQCHLARDVRTLLRGAAGAMEEDDEYAEDDDADGTYDDYDA